MLPSTEGLTYEFSEAINRAARSTMTIPASQGSLSSPPWNAAKTGPSPVGMNRASADSNSSIVSGSAPSAANRRSAWSPWHVPEISRSRSQTTNRTSFMADLPPKKSPSIAPAPASGMPANRPCATTAIFRNVATSCKRKHGCELRVRQELPDTISDHAFSIPSWAPRSTGSSRV